jgi:hypothetical protein
LIHVGILELLLMLAQDDTRVVRVPVPPRLCAPAPARSAELLEARSARTLERSLAVHTGRRVLEARAGGLVLKRYLVGVGSEPSEAAPLPLGRGGLYAIDGRWAYVLDPGGDGILLRDQDADEVSEFVAAGTRLIVHT